MSQKLPEWLGKKRIINHHFENIDCNIIRWEVLSINPKQRLKVKFIGTRSEYRQGIRIAIDSGKGKLTLNGVSGREFILWEDKCPKEFEIECIYLKKEIGLGRIVFILKWILAG